MTTLDKKLIKLLKERNGILDKGDSGFIKIVKKIQKQIATLVVAELEKFSRQGGRLSSGSSDTKILLRIERQLKKIFRSAKLQKEAGKLLAGFKRIEEVNESLYSNVLDRKVKLPININKKLLTDKVLDSFKDDVLTAQFINPLKQIIFESIKFQKGFEETKDAVVARVGRLNGYASVVTRDIVNQYDGAINDQIRDEFELNGFTYVGSLVEDSRQNCIDLVNGTGRFAQFAIRPGVYATADRQAIINAAYKGKDSGFNSAVTVQNFAQIRMGWNCNHRVIYIPLLDEEIPERLRLLQTESNDN